MFVWMAGTMHEPEPASRRQRAGCALPTPESTDDVRVAVILWVVVGGHVGSVPPGGRRLDGRRSLLFQRLLESMAVARDGARGRKDRPLDDPNALGRDTQLLSDVRGTDAVLDACRAELSSCQRCVLLDHADRLPL